MNVSSCPVLCDSELLELMKQGDHKAFELIYNRYAARLYCSAYNLLRDKTICEDLVQELFVSLWIKRNHLKINTLKSYLYAAIRNSVLMVVRSGRGHLDLSLAKELAQTYTTDHQVIEKEITSLLNQSIASLPEKCRQIFFLSRKEQLSNKEIASQLNISAKTVENQITIAIRRLRITFGDFLILGFLFFYPL
jgi:RNA polymerase sigma-70 factor (family 1)